MDRVKELATPKRKALYQDPDKHSAFKKRQVGYRATYRASLLADPKKRERAANLKFKAPRSVKARGGRSQRSKTYQPRLFRDVQRVEPRLPRRVKAVEDTEGNLEDVGNETSGDEPEMTDGSVSQSLSPLHLLVRHRNPLTYEQDNADDLDDDIMKDWSDFSSDEEAGNIPEAFVPLVTQPPLYPLPIIWCQLRHQNLTSAQDTNVEHYGDWAGFPNDGDDAHVSESLHFIPLRIFLPVQTIDCPGWTLRFCHLYPMYFNLS